MKLSKEFRFEASHQLPKHPGKCSRLHGHSWVLVVSVEGLLNPDTGMVLDYADLKAAVQPIVDRLDHQHLGNGYVIYGQNLRSTVEGLSIENPTSEELLWWIASQLPPELPWHTVSLKETCTTDAELTHEEWARGRREDAVLKETSRSESKGTSQEVGPRERPHVGKGKDTSEEALLITDEDLPKELRS